MRLQTSRTGTRLCPENAGSPGLESLGGSETPLRISVDERGLRARQTRGAAGAQPAPESFHLPASLTSETPLGRLLPSWMLLTVAVAVVPLASIFTDSTLVSRLSTWASWLLIAASQPFLPPSFVTSAAARSSAQTLLCSPAVA